MGVWLRRLAIVCLLGFPAAVLGTRYGLFDYIVGLKMTAATLLASLVVFVIALIVMFWLRNRNPVGSKSALAAALICAIPLLGIGSQLIKARGLPQIHNISTDLIDPPGFSKISQIRTSSDNPLEYNIAELASVQQAAYPNIKTLYTDMTLGEAHRKALSLAEALGWEVVNEDVVTGLIEATETSVLWKFKDDIVIRLRNHGDRVAVDLRSVSRVGRSDIGANAERINAFLTAFEQ